MGVNFLSMRDFKTGSGFGYLQDQATIAKYRKITGSMGIQDPNWYMHFNSGMSDAIENGPPDDL